MTRKCHPWIVVDASQDLALVCKRCGAFAKIQFPVPISVYVDAGRAFIRIHKSCVDRPQVKL
jgi:hypothetical protein